jgi:SAM-dependent methyltransferase
MFRWFRWHRAKRCLARLNYPPSHIRRCSRRHTGPPQELSPDTPPYDQLASLWDEYAGWFVPEYGRFLLAAGEHYRTRLESVLDLACGTGLLCRQVAGWAERVVGLDISEAMLRRAESRAGPSNVRYTHGDFRNFSLGESFDAVVCGSDSLNYVQTPAELEDVFRCCRRHLRPGGLFVFDVLDQRMFRAVDGVVNETEMPGGRVEMCCFYDADRRVGRWRVACGDAVEQHSRIPLEEEDVRRAAGAAGLEVDEHFSPNSYRLRQLPAARQFYVLKSPGV